MCRRENVLLLFVQVSLFLGATIASKKSFPKDIFECPVHDCLPDVSCPYGFALDEYGCTTCQCLPYLPPGCAAITCQIGSVCKEVVSGCENPPPGQPCDPVVSYICVPICPLLKCRECVSGNVIDKNGCRTCACNDPCEGVTCPNGQMCEKFDGSASRYRCVPSKQCNCPDKKIISHKGLKCVKVCNLLCAIGYKCCPDRYGCVSCQKCKY